MGVWDGQGRVPARNNVIDDVDVGAGVEEEAGLRLGARERREVAVGMSGFGGVSDEAELPSAGGGRVGVEGGVSNLPQDKAPAIVRGGRARGCLG